MLKRLTLMLVGAKEPMEKNLGKGRVRLINCQE
jgi:hypothetical protein